MEAVEGSALGGERRLRKGQLWGGEQRLRKGRLWGRGDQWLRKGGYRLWKGRLWGVSKGCRRISSGGGVSSGCVRVGSGGASAGCGRVSSERGGGECRLRKGRLYGAQLLHPWLSR